MPYDPEDPRLTAYALGELDEKEMREFERDINGSPEALAAVHEVREMARLMATSLSLEPGPGPHPSLYKSIEDEIASTPATVPMSMTSGTPRSWQTWAGYAVAASALVGFGLSAAWLTVRPMSRQGDMAIAMAPATKLAEPDAFGEKLSLGRVERLPVTMIDRANLESHNGAIVKATPRSSSDAYKAMQADAPATSPAYNPQGGARSLDMRGGRAGEAHFAEADRAGGASPAEGMMGGMGGMGGGGMMGNKPAIGAGSVRFGAPAVPGQPDAGAGHSGLAARGRSKIERLPAKPPGVTSFNGSLATVRPGLDASAPNVGSYGRANFGRARSDQMPADRSGVSSEAKKLNDLAPAASKPDSQVALGLEFRKTEELAKRKVSAVEDRLSDFVIAQNQPAPASQPATPPPAEAQILEQLTTRAQADGLALAELKDVERGAVVPEVQLQIEPLAQVEAPANEQYSKVEDNPFKAVAAEPLSTFSIDVDTASYANIRRFLMAENRLPPPDAVRIEEMVNYFPYSYEAPATSDEKAPPFSVDVEIAEAPWNRDHRLARIGLKGKVDTQNKPSNLVFLIDVSGSMDQANKLPLVQASMRMLTEQLGENDRVAIVVYAGAAGLVLDSTSGLHKYEIASAIDGLRAGGSTAGGAGINLAYDVAKKNFVNNGVNRVILATDGDFNVGISDNDQLEAMITEKAKTGVFLSVLAFGTGNVKDARMEGLADKGNGNYAYIDSLLEARKVLVDQMVGTLVTIAKDVKIQVDFNPAQVGTYRLIGYENRIMAAEDFANDAKDAGEIGAGHTVTALYELTPPSDQPASKDQESKYSKVVATDPKNPELFTLKLRYKAPDGDKSTLMEQPITDAGKAFPAASEDFKFASSVASFGMILRNSPHKGTASLASLLEIAESSKGKDEAGYRKEFCEMVRKAQSLLPK